MKLGSLFSGIGGFELGFQDMAECVFQVEIERNCQKLLRDKFPKAKLYEDIRTFRPDLVTDRVDIICGGSPCQDLSVAGKRAGLDGERSGLFAQMVRVCKRLRPRYVVWENVDGAFSSQCGRDFACVIRAFTGFAPAVPENGWGRGGFVRTPFPEMRWHIAWRVFDAQYFGLAQRRKRVLLVGSFGDASCLEILFEPQSLCWDSPPSREAGQRVTPPIAGCSNGGGANGPGRTADDAEALVPSCANPIGAHHGRHDLDHDTYVPELARSLNAERDGYNDGSDQTYIPIQSINMKRERKQNGIGIGQPGDEMYTLTARDHHAVAFSASDYKTGAYEATDIARPLTTSADRSRSAPIAFQTRIARNGRGQPEEICPALNGSDAGATSDMRPTVAGVFGVRRLTPLECERLQGFPEGHTAGFSDSVRYRLLGNAVPPPLIRWLARRMKGLYANHR